MHRFTRSKCVEDLPYRRTEHTLLPLSDTREEFIRATAEFFVQSWMEASLPQMLEVWKNWGIATEEERQQYYLYLNHLFSEDGTLIDDPRKDVGQTEAIATFSETMLRWARKHPLQRIVEPCVPVPPAYGDIDLIEITGTEGDYASLQLTMWEAKGSDTQASAHNDKIYNQLKTYPRRFYTIANALATRYKDTHDLELLRFLRRLNIMVRNREPQVHYGAFITYDTTVPQKRQLVPNLHKHPPNHPKSGENCHHLVLLLVPHFRELRLDIWRCLHLMED